MESAVTGPWSRNRVLIIDFQSSTVAKNIEYRILSKEIF